MTTLTLRLEPAAAKVFHFYHDVLAGQQPELCGLFRQLVIMTAEPMWDKEKQAYKIADDQADLSVSIDVSVLSWDGRKMIDMRQAVWIAPHKMRWMNDMVIELLEMEINATVDRFLETGGQIRDGIKSTLDKYDIDEETEYKMETALQMNLRYRRKTGVPN